MFIVSYGLGLLFGGSGTGQNIEIAELCLIDDRATLSLTDDKFTLILADEDEILETGDNSSAISADAPNTLTLKPDITI